MRHQPSYNNVWQSTLTALSNSIMSNQPPIKNSARSTSDVAPLSKMLVDLDEKDEASLSAGRIDQSPTIKYHAIIRLGSSRGVDELTHVVQSGGTRSDFAPSPLLPQALTRNEK